MASALAVAKNRTYKVICWWVRAHSDHVVIPVSISWLFLNFVGDEYWAKKIEMLAKGVFVGNSGVGKTSVLRRYCQDTFSDSFITTIGIDFLMRTIEIEPYNSIKFQLWETAGRERFRTITAAYYRRAHIIFIMFDLTNRSSFDDTREWLIQVAAGMSEPNALIVFVGTKLDLCAENKKYEGNEAFLNEIHREVSTETVQNYINDQKALYPDILDMLYWETSAKESTNIEEMFMDLSHRLLRLQRMEDNPATANVDLKQTNASANSSDNRCC